MGKGKKTFKKSASSTKKLEYSELSDSKRGRVVPITNNLAAILKGKRSEKKIVKGLQVEKTKTLKEKSEDITCHICGKYLPSTIKLVEHMRVHTTPFQSNGNETSLYKMVTNPVPTNSASFLNTFLCLICDKTFSSQEALKFHMCSHNRHKTKDASSQTLN